MSSELVRRRSTSSASSQNIENNQPSTAEEEDWQLKLALKLSSQTYEMERTRRSNSLSPRTQIQSDSTIRPETTASAGLTSNIDLIDLEDPKVVARMKKIEAIKKIQREYPVGSLPTNGASSTTSVNVLSRISGGSGIYGMPKIYSTPNFPSIASQQNLFSTIKKSPETNPNAGGSSTASASHVVHWRSKSDKGNDQVTFRLPPPPRPPPPNSSTMGTAAVYYRKNNNLVIPYVKSIAIWDDPSQDDNLIKFVPENSAVESLTSEELLKIFDPLFSEPICVGAENAAATANVLKHSAESRTKSAPDRMEKAASAFPSTDKDTTNVRSRSYQQQSTPSISATSWNELRLIERLSDVERQGKRLYDSVLATRTPESCSDPVEDIWHDVIIARRVHYPFPSVTDVMVVVHTNLSSSPLKFTCAVGSSVDQVLETVLFTCDLQHQQQNLYALKVFGRDEYLIPQSVLCDYVYVHNSIKLGKDIILQLGSAPKPKSKQSNAYETGMAGSCFPSVERKDVELVLQMIKSELRRVQESLQSNGPIQSSRAVQAIKALCSILHNVEPPDLCAAVSRFNNACDKISVRKLSHVDSYNGNSEFRKSEDFALDVERAIESLASALHGFLSAYCRSSNASFAPAPLKRRPSSVLEEQKEFVNMEDPFLFYVGSVHNLNQDWHQFARFFVSAYIFHGVNEIAKKERSAIAFKEAGLYRFLKVDSWISFDNSRLCTLPREARVCVVLYGVRVESHNAEAGPPNAVKSIVEEQLAWGCIPLFDSENCLAQGSHFVPMTLDATIQPWGPPTYVGEFNKHLPILTMTLPTFEHEIRFPSCVQLAPVRSSYAYDQLDSDQRCALDAIFDSAANVKELARDEKDLLWEMRLYLTKKPEALPLVLSAAFSWDCLFLSHIYQLLKVWANVETAQAIELLLPRFPDREVRKFATQSMTRSGADELLGYLSQLVEALQFELYEDSALAQLLLRFAVENRRFAFALFWLLEERRSQSLYGCRCYLMQKMLLRILGDAVATEIQDQLLMVRRSDTVATDLKNCRPEDREAIMRANLEVLDGYLLHTHVRLPLNPSVWAVGIDVGKSTYYNTNTVPMKIAYRSLNSCFEVLHKIGDDLRQDALVMQMIRLMNDVWLNEGLDLRIITFHCLPTGQCKGMIEAVSDSKTLNEIYAEEGGGVTGALREDLAQRWIQKHNSSELDYEMALKNFRLSCAGWCVATYVLGIGDRHSDNVMITNRGHVFHIDFGKYLGDAQTFGGIKRDRTPFLLTNDMVYVINAGQTKTTAFFQDFVDNCCLAFNILRKNCGLFINLMKLMVCSGIPGLSMDAVEYISQNFCIGYSESKATEYFTRMIEETMKSSFPKWNFLIHALAQQRKPAPASVNDRLLSFVPKIFTEQTDGRILSVDVVDCQKWRLREMKEKVYMYKIKVVREYVKFPYFIYRSYKEFCEFYGLLSLRFPLVSLYGLSRNLNLGRTNIREVAERRRLEIALFLESLFLSSDEVVHCDLVYTFFHSIFRDQETEPTVQDDTRGGLQNVIRGEIKIALEYREEKLEVFIGHVRDLPAGIGGTSPDVYVKCYLRPGHSGQYKRKTRIMPRSQNPTFNEMLEYKFPLTFFVGKQLEVTVWRHDVLKENVFLGGVLIVLDDILRTTMRKKLDRWYPLEHIRQIRW